MKKIHSGPTSSKTLEAAQQHILTALKASSPLIDSTLPNTCQRDFGPVDSTLQPMFSLRAGICAHDALMHVSLLLLCAEQTSDEITELGSGVERDLIWSMVHSVEMARAVVDSLLDSSQHQSL